MSLKNNILSYFFLSNLIIGFSHSLVSGVTSTVTVNCNDSQGTIVRIEKYTMWSDNIVTNNTLVEKQKIVSGGGSRIIRSGWCPLETWDHTTNTFNFDKEHEPGHSSREYMQNMSASCDQILVTVMRKTDLVLQNKITYTQWGDALYNALKWYKQNFPKIQYLECLNERDITDFGQLTSAQYYNFYKECYRVVNKVNSELGVSIQIGGPTAADLQHEQWIKDFLTNYKIDSNSAKKFQFFSYHSYPFDITLSAGEFTKIKKWLSDLGLNTNIPIYLTEFGAGYIPSITNPAVSNVTVQAVAAANLAKIYFMFYSTSSVPAYPIPFQYAFKPNPVNGDFELFSLISKDNSKFLPFGNVMLMHTKMKSTRISSVSSSLNNNRGIMTFGSKNDSSVTIMVMNYQFTDGTTEHTTTVNIQNLPNMLKSKNLSIKQYLVDETTSNYVYNQNVADLKTILDTTMMSTSSISTSLHLKKNAIALIEITAKENSTKSKKLMHKSIKKSAQMKNGYNLSGREIKTTKANNSNIETVAEKKYLHFDLNLNTDN